MNRQNKLSRSLALLLTLALIFSFIPVRSAHAGIQRIYVTPGSTDVSFGQNLGICTLREAIRAINNHRSFDGCPADATTNEIVLPAGTFILTRAVNGDDFAYSGDLDILSGVTITGAGSNQTSIIADNMQYPFSDRIFHIIGKLDSTGQPAITVTLKNLRIAGGYAQDGKGGGGILNEKANLFLKNVILEKNEAMGGRKGGGVLNSVNSTLDVDNATFIDNKASLGGGIYNENNAVITNSLFERNEAFVGGGGVDNDPSNRVSGYLKVTNVTFASNSSPNKNGAGINNSGNLEVTNVTLAYNIGVGIFLNGDSTVPYSATIRNTIMAYQAPASGCEMQNTSTKFKSGGYNLVDSTANDNPAARFLCPFNSEGITTDILDQDPKLTSSLMSFGHNSTRTFDFADINSPAVDVIPSNDPYCLPNDQIFHKRPANGDTIGTTGCDIGAYELGGESMFSYLFLPFAKR